MSNFLCFRPKFHSPRPITANDSLRRGQFTESLRRKFSTPNLKRKFTTPMLARKAMTPKRLMGGRPTTAEKATREFDEYQKTVNVQSILERAVAASDKRKMQNRMYQKKCIFPPKVL